MNRHYTLRRAALPLLALVAALTVSRHSSWGQTTQTPGPGTLEGTWTLTVTPTPGPGAPPPFQSLATFTSNGGFISTDASATGVNQGSWVQTGDHIFNLSFMRLLFDSKGQFSGSQKEQGAITASGAFDAWSGPSKVEFLDPTGKIVFVGTATVQAARMPVEPIQ